MLFRQMLNGIHNFHTFLFVFRLLMMFDLSEFELRYHFLFYYYYRLDKPISQIVELIEMVKEMPIFKKSYFLLILCTISPNQCFFIEFQFSERVKFKISKFSIVYYVLSSLLDEWHRKRRFFLHKKHSQCFLTHKTEKHMSTNE